MAAPTEEEVTVCSTKVWSLVDEEHGLEQRRGEEEEGTEGPWAHMERAERGERVMSTEEGGAAGTDEG